MPLDTVLADSTLLRAIAIYIAAVVGVELFSAQLYYAVREVGFTAWIVEHLGIPLARTATLLLFLFAAYPALFGLSWAPALSSLLQDGDGRIRYLLNATFVITLLLPLLPMAIARLELILPLQGITASALLFHWLAVAMGRTEVDYWPGNLAAIAIVVVGVIIGPFATLIGRLLGDSIDRVFERYDSEQLVREGVILLLQIPLLLIYTLSIGERFIGM